MAVGLNILSFILTTSVCFSFVEHRNKVYDHVLELLIVHHHGKAQWILDELLGKFSVFHIDSYSRGKR